MTRHNLWVTLNGCSKVVCYGLRSEMNDIALLAGVAGDVHVLPDGHEPNEPTPCEQQ
jgi:hypothetical protein